MVTTMKGTISKQLEELPGRVPKMAQIINQYAGQMKQAAATDAYIDNMINHYKENPNPQEEGNINKLIDKAVTFYTQLQQRLDKIEAMA